MITEAIRNYEVSIWTLQDDFITVLKWSNLEQKGGIQNPKLTLSVDGTQEFTFSIPMYIHNGEKLVENPIWYNTRNGNIAVAMRKIKVIFNKDIFDIEGVNWKEIFNRVYFPKQYRGNVNLYNRPILASSYLSGIGYSGTPKSIDSLYPQIGTFTKNSRNYYVIYTPIGKDGTVYGKAGMNSYLQDIFTHGANPKEWLAYDLTNSNSCKQSILGIIPDSRATAESFCAEISALAYEWNCIRAANNWFGLTPVLRLNNTEIPEPSYNLYRRYLSSQNIFEFLITKINETHEGDVLTCEISCEGLAFHELGKRGYIYDLSVDDFELVYKEWQEGGQVNEEPKENVQFWCERIGLKPLPISSDDIDPNQWYYTIQMDYSSYSDHYSRDPDCIYEEPFATRWVKDTNTNLLVPKDYNGKREKWRPIEANESNIYNITQTIAEKFEVYCRYEYGHDSNHHIVSRTVVFFNNFIHDNHIISLTYPYSSKKISREMDSTDIVTKLYVRPTEDYSTLMGDMNIRYCEANKTQEDYILNFNYLKETGNISDAQYNAIGEFETKMRDINEALYPLENQISILTTRKSELEGKKTFYTNSVKIDDEQKAYNKEYIAKLTGEDGTQDQYIDLINEQNPETAIISHDENNIYCIKLDNSKKGIKPETVKIYRSYDSVHHTLSNQETNFSFDYGEYDNPVRIYGLAPAQNGSSIVYLTYTYEPILYYKKVADMWQVKMNNDQNELDKITEELDNPTTGINALLEYTQNAQAELLAEKREAENKFEKFMGPALREGYWQPEEYSNYGELYEDTKIFPDLFDNTFVTENTGTDFFVGWDKLLFDEEQDIYYYRTVNSTKVAYPIIDLSTLSSANLSTFFANVNNNYSFIYNNNYYDTTADQSKIQNIRSFSIGSQAILGFIYKVADNTIHPVLILVGAKNMTDEELTFMQSYTSGGSVGGNPRLGKLTTTNDNGNITTTITDVINLAAENWYTIPPYATHLHLAVYPRIKFSSLMLKTSTNLYIRYNNHLLENYKDYQVLNRHVDVEPYAPEYYVTIKPATMARYGDFFGSVHINYCISNASTAIYIDALKVSDENAVPKVSYTVDPNILDKYLLKDLQNKLNWLVMINDVQLKFKNVFGYISKLELDLDFPEKDSIEIKNYKTKFEDLFSTIVAQTEAMKKSSGLLSALAGGSYNLNGDGLENSIATNTQIITTYLDNYIGTSEYVKQFLASLFKEAGDILSDANQTLNQNKSLTIENSTILSSFATTIQRELVPSVFRQENEPKIFKKNDIWIQINTSTNEEVARYIAVTDSSNSVDGCGWMQTYNGGLGQIRGAGMDIDVAAGKISITAENKIYLGTGNILKLEGHDVFIEGTNSVNIGGVTINIGSNSALSNEYGGINLIATGYNEDVNSANYGRAAKVLIKPTEISMYGSKISMAAGRVQNNVTTSVSGLLLDPDKGVWIGSTNRIRFYTDNLANVTDNTVANVEIDPNHLFFGMYDTTISGAKAGSSTAFELTNSHIILAAGDVYNQIKASGSTGIVLNGNIAGLEITKEKIGFATGANAARNVIIMDSGGIKVGSGTDPATNGSFVYISGSGVSIGSQGTLSINTTNFKVVPNASGTNQFFFVGNSNKYIEYLANGTLNIKGGITATTLTVGDNGSYMKYDSSGLNIANGGLTYNGSALSVTGALTATALTVGNTSSNNYMIYNGSTLTVKGAITATTLTVGSDDHYMNFNGSTLTVKGNITASAGKIGDYWNIGAHSFENITDKSLEKVFLGKVSFNNLDWAFYVGAPNAEGYWDTKNSSWAGDRPDYWAPFRVNTKGELYTEVLCLGNGPANTFGDVKVGGNGWADYVGKLWLFVKYADNDYRWECIDSTALWKAVTNSSSNSGYTPNKKPSGGKDSEGGDSSGTGGCFIAGTQVTLASGKTIAIEKLQLGMKIIAYDEVKQQFDEAEITFVQMLKHKSHIYDIHLSTGKVITLTASHPLLTTNGWRSLDIDTTWKEYKITVNTLQINDKLISPYSDNIYIKDIKYREDLINTTVYHCRVDPYHTFIVEDVVAHNMKVTVPST